MSEETAAENSLPPSGRMTLALLGKDLKYIQAAQADLLAEVRAINAHLNRIDERMTRVEEKNDGLDDKYDTLDGSVTRLYNRDLTGTIATAVAAVVAGVLAFLKH